MSNDLALRMQEASREAVDKVIDLTISEMAVKDQTKNKQLEEAIFVGIFLPLFLGEVEVSHGATISHWIEFAGGYFNEVDIIDNPTNREVLFTVPSYFNDKAIKPLAKRDGDMLGDVLKEAELHSKLHPTRGQAYMTGAFNDRINKITDNSSLVDNMAKWDAIFKRYGKEAFKGIVNKNTETISNDDITGDTDEYELA